MFDLTLALVWEQPYWSTSESTKPTSSRWAHLCQSGTPISYLPSLAYAYSSFGRVSNSTRTILNETFCPLCKYTDWNLLTFSVKTTCGNWRKFTFIIFFAKISWNLRNVICDCKMISRNFFNYCHLKNIPKNQLQ